MSRYYEDCNRCFGKGRINENQEEESCKHCNGYGHHMTAVGHELIDFLSRRGFPLPMSPIAEDELSAMIE
jgi:DnaJ-class molecular chaperone